jgi:3-dehydroquinate dehydratase-2
MAKDVWVLHGPNLGLLGRREPAIYGRETLETIDRRLAALGGELGLAVASFQTNHEGALIDRITVAMDQADGCLINPAALSHTSLALADAIRAVTIPVVEVHMTNLYAREAVRQESLTGSAARGVVMGFGPASYELGLRALAALLAPSRPRGKRR